MSKPNLIHYRLFESYEEYVRWYRISFVGVKYMLKRHEWEEKQHPNTIRLVIMTPGEQRREDRYVRVPIVETGTAAKFVCPACEEEKVKAWSDDDGSEPQRKADWWECEACGVYGAIAHQVLPGVTRNGVPIMGHSRLKVTS